MFVKGSERNEQSQQQTFHRCFLPIFIYGKSSVVIAHFIPIHLQKWPPQAILVSEWPIFENL
jgi:hypothetical protein